ncbi:MAG TPA: enoyl-CoA hydratase/isomerase family protein [Frankiaceae bacterium]|nr:enoyl-CoA hydratase/isomerase family protein [Frankiaceae bacterium]
MLLGTSISAGVATVTIDHPPTNLVDGAFITALIEVLERTEPDPSVRVLLFRSADPDFFLMHGDVEQILAIPAGQYAPVTEPNVAAAVFQRLSAGPLVTIGLLDGAARGGGCEFLSALDLRLGSPRSVVGQPEVAMGILPGAGGTVRWPRLVGRAKALDIILSGRDVEAQELLEIGWLDRLFPRADLDATGVVFARRIAAMPLESIAAVKRVVDVSLSAVEPALVAESDALAHLLSQGVQQVPMRAFLAAGGQTRQGEIQRMPEILEAMLDRPHRD